MNKTMLVILDGLGLGEEVDSNAYYMAKTPFLDRLMKECPTSRLKASGASVGLPEWQIGNSEVGHLNLGAGRVVYQDLTRINEEIKAGKIYENPVLEEAMEGALSKDKALHLIGLVSHGGVHSSYDHLLALIKMAKKKGLKEVYIHAFLDGRDVLPQVAKDDIKDLETFLEKEGLGEISTIVGRYYAMDRDSRWDRIELAYDAMVRGKGKVSMAAEDAIKESYAEGIDDEFVKPIVMSGRRIAKGDSLIFFNFRADRARQISRALREPGFDEFPVEDLGLDFYTLTKYDDYDWAKVIYGEEKIKNTLGEYLASKGASQLRIAETEKYAHVTFFFNGGVEEPYPEEYRILIASPKVATYDEKPEMSAEEITDRLICHLEKDRPDYVTINYANCDMVGHTGKLDAAIRAVEEVDRDLERLVNTAKDLGYKMLITADHGNCEKMKEDGKDAPYTAHTTNEVPLILVGKEAELVEGKLANVAPTILDLMGLEKPEEMTEESLIRRK